MRPSPHPTLVSRFLTGLQASRPRGLTTLLGEILPGAEVVLHLVNLEQTDLVPLNTHSSVRRSQQTLHDGAAGRCFTTSTQVSRESDTGRRTIWTPVSQGSERLGVLEVTSAGPADADPHDPAELAELADLAIAIGLNLAAQRGRSDDLELARRSQELSLGAELLWSVLPPPSHVTSTISLSVMLEPTYSTGGDAYDYAVDGDIVHLLVLDAMGHGFPAAQLSTLAVAAYRHSRRLGLDLPGTLRAMDDLVAGGFDALFATAVLVQLDTTTGRLTWVSAGHPEPLLLRRSRAEPDRAETLHADPSPPLGVGVGLGPAQVQEDYLEPGDVLVLYTDGVTEARHTDGTMVSADGFADLVARETAVEMPIEELVRRLRQKLLAAEDAWLSDDVTALLLRWQPEP